MKMQKESLNQVGLLIQNLLKFPNEPSALARKGDSTEKNLLLNNSEEIDLEKSILDQKMKVLSTLV
jgi:hypothetical protein